MLQGTLMRLYRMEGCEDILQNVSHALCVNRGQVLMGKSRQINVSDARAQLVDEALSASEVISLSYASFLMMRVRLRCVDFISEPVEAKVGEENLVFAESLRSMSCG